jgi:hypothetical protein
VPDDRNLKSEAETGCLCFVLDKNSPAYRINTHLRTYKAILTRPIIFGMDFLAKCFETKILWILESPIITTALAWRPRLLPGDIVLKNSYGTPGGPRTCISVLVLQYLKSYIVICKTLSMNRSYTISGNSEPINAAIATVYNIWNLIL